MNMNMHTFYRSEQQMTYWVMWHMNSFFSCQHGFVYQRTFCAQLLYKKEFLTDLLKWQCDSNFVFRTRLTASELNTIFDIWTDQDAKEAIKTLNNYEIRPGRFLVVTKSVDNRRLWVSCSSHLPFYQFVCRSMESPRTGQGWKSEGRWKDWLQGCAISSSIRRRRTRLNLGGETSSYHRNQTPSKNIQQITF